MPRSLTNRSLWSQLRGKCSRHSRRMRNLQFYVSGKRPIDQNTKAKYHHTIMILKMLPHRCGHISSAIMCYYGKDYLYAHEKHRCKHCLCYNSQTTMSSISYHLPHQFNGVGWSFLTRGLICSTHVFAAQMGLRDTNINFPLSFSFWCGFKSFIYVCQGGYFGIRKYLFVRVLGIIFHLGAPILSKYSLQYLENATGITLIRLTVCWLYLNEK